jgi:hypothetical protein
VTPGIGKKTLAPQQKWRMVKPRAKERFQVTPNETLIHRIGSVYRQHPTNRTFG